MRNCNNNTAYSSSPKKKTKLCTYRCTSAVNNNLAPLFATTPSSHHPVVCQTYDKRRFRFVLVKNMANKRYGNAGK